MFCPRIAITAGEPAGIGPDIVLMAAQQAWEAQLIVVADPALLQQRATALNLPIELRVVETGTTLAGPHQPGILNIAPVALAAPATPGKLDPLNAAYILQTLQQAADGCMNGDYHAMVTAPVQKSVINDAGIAFSGHTEFLAEVTGSEQVVMMLATQDLRVALATTHLPLKAVPAAITAPLLLRTLTIVQSELQDRFGIPRPKIAVLGLNPHAGEGGHLGREEIDTIIPALQGLRADGMDLLGPLPADTAFNRKVLDTVDAVFAMYHDQGLPVLKYAGFGNAVNISLGLPIIRTSVDHGTALDLAATGQADAGSLREAITQAINMSGRP